MIILIDPAVYVITALFLLTIPIEWLVAAACAAAFHELCHIAVIRLCGGKIEAINVGAGGAEIVSCLDRSEKDLASAMAGPFGSFLLMGVCRIFPKVAICGCIQGLFNLLPIFPMDGGRILQCVFSYLWPHRLQEIQVWIKRLSLAVILGLGIAGTLMWKLGNWPILCAALFFAKVIFRKRPCKDKRFRVQ